MTLARLCMAATVTGLFAAQAMAQDADRWRYFVQPDGGDVLSVAFGGDDGEDTWIAMWCDQSGPAPILDLYIVADTRGYPEGSSVPLVFYGPAWEVSLNVTVDPPGLYESVSTRISFAPGDLVYRSTFANVGPVNLRLGTGAQFAAFDFSVGRPDLLAFLSDCEQSVGQGTAVGATDAVLQP